MNDPEKMPPFQLQEASEQACEECSDNKQTFAANGIKDMDEAVLANVTGVGGIVDVITKGYHSLPLRFHPEGGTKPETMRPTIAVSKQYPKSTVINYIGENSPNPVKREIPTPLHQGMFGNF
jgi:hypothetical protein